MKSIPVQSIVAFRLLKQHFTGRSPLPAAVQLMICMFELQHTDTHYIPVPGISFVRAKITEDAFSAGHRTSVLLLSTQESHFWREISEMDLNSVYYNKSQNSFENVLESRRTKKVQNNLQNLTSKCP